MPRSPKRIILNPPHTPETCPQPRNKDGSGCICDLRRWAKIHSDWPIAELVGAATYAQLLDSGSGLFEPFADYRTDGNSASTIPTLDTMNEKNLFFDGERWLTKNEHVPFPPNLVSVNLVESGVSPADLKRQLISSSSVNVSLEEAESLTSQDGWVVNLIDSSRSYSAPEMSLSEITWFFIVMSALIGLVGAVVLRSVYFNVK